MPFFILNKWNHKNNSISAAFNNIHGAHATLLVSSFISRILNKVILLIGSIKKKKYSVHCRRLPLTQTLLCIFFGIFFPRSLVINLSRKVPVFTSVDILKLQRTHSTEGATPLFSDPTWLWDFAHSQKPCFLLQAQCSKSIFKVPSAKLSDSWASPRGQQEREKRPRDAEMNFEGAILAIIQRLPFVLLNVGGRQIGGCVCAGPNCLSKVVE